MRFAAEMLRHKALGFQWHVPAFGEEVGMWRSHDKKQARSARHKGAIRRLIAIDPWGKSTCVLIAKGSDLQDPELSMVFNLGVQSTILRGQSCLQKTALADPNAAKPGCPPYS